jgi:hypothetical protein
MAELVSPGVSVSIIDESFYSPAGTGTVPLIVIATSQDKTTPDGVSVAEGTTAANAGEVALVTSQRDLLYRYGTPDFQTDSSGLALTSELNEYGLFAAYSFLGIANRAYVLRADVNLADLSPSATEPTTGPIAGSYWLDTADTIWGLKAWDGSGWVRQSVSVVPETEINSSNEIKPSFSGNIGDFAVKYFDYNGGDYDTADSVEIYEKISTASGPVWSLVGSANWVTATGGDFQVAYHTNLPLEIGGRSDDNNLEVGDLLLQMNEFNLGTTVDLRQYTGGQWLAQEVFGSQYSYQAWNNYSTAGGLQAGDVWAQYDGTEASVVLSSWNGLDTNTAQSSILTDTEVEISTHVADLSVVANSTTGANAVLSAVVGGIGVGSFIDSITIVDGGDGYSPGNAIVVVDNNGNGGNFTATVDTVDGNGAITAVNITNSGSGYFTTSFTITVNDADVVNGSLGTIKVPFYGYDDGANSAISVDSMVLAIQDAVSQADAGATFADDLTVSSNNSRIQIVSNAGYNIEIGSGQVPGFNPSDLGFDSTVFTNWNPITYTASDEEVTGSLSTGTLWYDNLISNDRIDILYNNAGTWTTYTAIADVQIASSEPTLTSLGATLSAGDLWIDSDDLENYPQIYKYTGTAWALVDNTDQLTNDGIVFGDFRSTVSQPGMDDDLEANGLQASLYPYGILAWNKRLSGGNIKEWDAVNERWNDKSGNKPNGSPYMLRRAQRQVIVAGMQGALNNNTNIRNENNRFNLIASPGYTECLDEMLTLSGDRKNTAFVIADAPLRLKSDATSISNWANNTSGLGNNDDDGLTSASEYAAVYYPHGRTSNLEGQDVIVPASHMALRTYAFNDQVAFPWFAPAGFQRGVVTNASTLGYVDPTSNEFVQVSLNEGQRDTLYINRVNPIAQFPGRGIAVFGQKTLQQEASALDRVNVARLVVYLRERLDDIVKPFLFEPNDEITRQNAKVVVDRFLGNLVSQRGLFDFVTVCDTTNNTPARIDRNELYIDIAVQPVKAVEFIYIPVRIQNTLGSA